MAEPTEPLETDSFSAEESQKMYEALAAELARVKVALSVWESSCRMAHDTTLQLERMTKALIAKIDGDDGHAQEDETVAQSCERAGKVVAELRAARKPVLGLASELCPACGKLSRAETAGCDHCDYEDK